MSEIKEYNFKRYTDDEISVLTDNQKKVLREVEDRLLGIIRDFDFYDSRQQMDVLVNLLCEAIRDIRIMETFSLELGSALFKETTCNKDS